MDEQLFQKGNALQQHPAQLGELATKVKLAEGKYTNLQKRNRLTEEALLAFEKETKAELKVLTQQVVELKRHITEIHSKLDIITGELSSVVKKHDFATVERYLDLWQPMRFVTRDEAKRIVEEVKHGR